ncbi:MAG: OB-fold nucleic acid binding domain-containing protein [Candidatus Aenigmatarchaeota archaeon]
MKISFVGFLICLFLLYILTLNLKVNNIKIGEIDKNLVGKLVNITGEVSEISYVNENIFVKIKDETGIIKIILWEDTINLLSAKGIDIRNIKKGVKINVVGEVEIYKGEVEIIPIRDEIHFL